jgi:hypothetical protein
MLHNEENNARCKGQVTLTHEIIFEHHSDRNSSQVCLRHATVRLSKGLDAGYVKARPGRETQVSSKLSPFSDYPYKM